MTIAVASLRPDRIGCLVWSLAAHYPAAAATYTSLPATSTPLLRDLSRPQHSSLTSTASLPAPSTPRWRSSSRRAAARAV